MFLIFNGQPQKWTNAEEHDNKAECKGCDRNAKIKKTANQAQILSDYIFSAKRTREELRT